MQSVKSLGKGIYLGGTEDHSLFCRKYDTFVITDEVYEHIVYPPHHHIYFASLPGCLKEPYLAVPCQKLIPSPDGDWVFDCTLLHC